MSELITAELVDLDLSAETKDAAARALAARMVAAGRVTDLAGFLADVAAREAQMPTGLDGGIGIPHCRSTHVTEPTLAFGRSAAGIDFGAPDGPADLIFLIAAPAGGDADHLSILSTLARQLMDETFTGALRSATESERTAALIRGDEAAGEPAPEQTEAEPEPAVETAGMATAAPAPPAEPSAAPADQPAPAPFRIVAVTSCPTGIAHTYMAAESLEQAGKAAGVEVAVETQGSAGFQRLDPQLVADADGVIFAHDVEVRDKERFAGKPTVDVGVKAGIGRAADLIAEVRRKAALGEVSAPARAAAPMDKDAEPGEGFATRLRKWLMTGVRYLSQGTWENRRWEAPWMRFWKLGRLGRRLGHLRSRARNCATWPKPWALTCRSEIGLEAPTVVGGGLSACPVGWRVCEGLVAVSETRWSVIVVVAMPTLCLHEHAVPPHSLVTPCQAWSVVTVAQYLVGSRASNLAKAQVREYLRPLRERFPDATFTHRVILEGGDKDRKSLLSSVSAVSGGSAFSTEQERALSRGDVDVVVHSLKDLPTANPSGLMLLPPPGREDVGDALCGSTLAGLRKGARVGTGAPRRIAQLLAVRPDLEIIPIRGNVPPRLKKIETMGLDAVVLAVAGLRRLGLDDAIGETLPLDLFPPSPGQGALGIQVRTDDSSAQLREILSTVGDVAVDTEIRAERALLAELHGGCSVPVGAYGETLPDGQLRLLGQVTSLDGAEQISGALTGAPDEPEKLGAALAAELVDQGAHSILDAVRAALAAR
ncbi:hydroxymethylbilane synthase [Streptomyces sp. ISID311]|uniref:hydroxymethylbilane synthase n=1 Tax=Streptomyces sp. ISID311 TaxID=2601673 RepID=UPI0021C3BD28|nr:hydroxymethylbilane synthase [Streptomyces sp. ISID311]